jgi:16S rRNA (guanine527-N7)-methyltransferase
MPLETFIDFLHSHNVSRETMSKFYCYEKLLLKWQETKNLIGKSTIASLWDRHFLDSAQLIDIPMKGPILDIGSGAGFPGLVLSILLPTKVFLVESDTKKSMFLNTVIAEVGCNAEVINKRLEDIQPFNVQTITARALAPLSRMLIFIEPFITSSTECIFLKGKNAQDELTKAKKDWNMKIIEIKSKTDSEATILHLKEVSRARS